MKNQAMKLGELEAKKYREIQENAVMISNQVESYFKLSGYDATKEVVNYLKEKQKTFAR